jgi:hypothetical protein
LLRGEFFTDIGADGELVALLPGSLQWDVAGRDASAPPVDFSDLLTSGPLATSECEKEA